MKQHSTEGFNKTLDSKRFEIIKPYLKGDSCIEIGSGNSHMTRKLLPLFFKVISFEPDRELPKMCTFDVDQRSHTSYHIRIEDCKQDIKADCIVCLNVIEHIKDTTKFLDKVKTFNRVNSVFIFSIPNAYSINRLIGSELGLIPEPTTLDKHDLKVGHKRMYSRLEFQELIIANGFRITSIFTQMYKPFHNKLMEKLPEEIKKYCLDMKLPNSGGEIFVIARLKK